MTASEVADADAMAQISARQVIPPGAPPRAAGGLGSWFAHPVVWSAFAALWWTGWLMLARPEDMTDLGLVSVVPLIAFLALPVLVAGFVRGLVRGAHPIEMTLHVLATIWILFAAAPILEGTLRLEAAWRHLGVVEHITRTGAVDPNIDAYFNWPIYFEMASFLARAAGLSDLRGIAPWAPVFFNLLYLAPMLLIARAASADRRTVWLAVWFFYLVNWAAQDYFAPQAFALFLYLVVLGVLLRWFGPREEWSPSVGRWLGSRLPESGPEVPGTTRAALMATVIGSFSVMVGAHQLTPVAAILVVGALVFIVGSRARGLPLLMAVIMIAWAIFLASAFLSGRLGEMVAALFSLRESASANVNDRLTGSSAHHFIVWTRLAAAGALYCVAAVGFLRGRRERSMAPFAILMGATFVLLPLQPYGGEMLLRVYLYASPFAVVLAAAAFLPRGEPRISKQTVTAIAVIGSLMMVTLFFTRYGNERGESFSSTDIAAMDVLYQIAPPGSVVIAGMRNLPWKFRGYNDYIYRLVVNLRPSEQQAEVPRLEDIMGIVRETRGTSVFVVMTASQRAQASLFGMLPPGGFDRMEVELSKSSAFEVVYSSADAVIWRLRTPVPTGGAR